MVPKHYLSEKVKPNNKQSDVKHLRNKLATHPHGIQFHSPLIPIDGHDGHGVPRGALLEQRYTIARPVLQDFDVVLARERP